MDSHTEPHGKFADDHLEANIAALPMAGLYAELHRVSTNDNRLLRSPPQRNEGTGAARLFAGKSPTTVLFVGELRAGSKTLLDEF